MIEVPVTVCVKTSHHFGSLSITFFINVAVRLLLFEIKLVVQCEILPSFCFCLQFLTQGFCSVPILCIFA